MLTAVCQEVNKIKIVRQMNASTRRLPFQKKIGAGLTVDEFTEKINSGSITGCHRYGDKKSISKNGYKISPRQGSSSGWRISENGGRKV